MSHISDEQIDSATSSAFDDGWRLCAKWARRDDLISDMDSKRYREDKSACGYAAPASAPTVQADDAITLTDRIAELIEQHGSLRAAARALQTNPGYLCRLASGEKSNPGEEVLTCMGLRAVTTYERIKP